MAKLEEKTRVSIEKDEHGKLWRNEWTEIYRGDVLVAGSKFRSVARRQLTPDAPPEDEKEVALFDAVYDESAIDAFFDKISARGLTDDQRSKVQARRNQAKQARQQRQRGKQK